MPKRVYSEIVPFDEAVAEEAQVPIIDALDWNKTKPTTTKEKDGSRIHHTPTSIMDTAHGEEIVKRNEVSNTLILQIHDLLDNRVPKTWREKYQSAITHYLSNILSEGYHSELETFIEKICTLNDQDKKKVLITFIKSHKDNIPIPKFMEDLGTFLEDK